MRVRAPSGPAITHTAMSGSGSGSSGSMTASEVFAALSQQLIAANAVAAVSGDFARLADDRERVEFVHELLKQQGLLAGCAASARCRKSAASCARLRQQAENARENGSQLHVVLQLFTEAVASGPPGSDELGKAYIGRSEVLFKLGIFDGCKEDLQLASVCANANRAQIKSKLVECEARVAPMKRAYEDAIPAISQPANRLVACASDAVTIEQSIDCGRFVTATKDIKMGDVIAVEEPFAVIVEPAADVSSTHCQQCLRVCLAPTPCDRCTLALYCSPECKARAWKHHHQFECAIMGELQELDLSKLTLFALRVAILAAPQYGVIETYATEDDTREERYESGRYLEIHGLCTNTALRSVADLFNRAVIAALIYEQVERKTAFFATAADANKKQAVFKGLLLRHMQIAPSNFHEITEKVRAADGEVSCVEIGGGAYSFLSMLNHSCAPNVVRHSHGSTIVLRALSAIRTGEQLFDNYGYHYAVMTKGERRQHLKLQYLFECQCRACVEDWPTYDKLETVAGKPEVTYEEIEALKSADREGILQILAALIKKAHILECLTPPTKNLADLQECIKECYSRLGNMRIT